MEMVIFLFFNMHELAEFALYYLFQKNLLEDEHQERGRYKIEAMSLKRNLMKVNFKVTIEQLF